MKDHFKALRWVLLPSIVVYLIASLVMLDFKIILNWFMLTNKTGIIVRLLTVTLEIISYIIIISYYRRDKWMKDFTFWRWLIK